MARVKYYDPNTGQWEYADKSHGAGGNAADGFSPIATVEQTATGAVVSITDKNGTTTATIANGKDGEDGEDGTDGKSAYAYAQDGGYTGTEEEFAEKMAREDSGGNVDWLDPEEGEVFTAIVSTPDEPDIPDIPDIPDEPDEPDVPEVTLTSISATYTGGNVAVGTAVTALTGITVTAHYSDGSTATVTDYTLSGTIAEGSNTIMVSYGGKTTTFVVTGEVEEEQEQIGQEGRAIIGNDGYVYIDIMTYGYKEAITYVDRSVPSSGFATFELHGCPWVVDTTSEVLFKNKFTYIGTSYSGIRNGTSSPEVQYGYGYDGVGGTIMFRIPYSDYESVGATPENISAAIALHCRYVPFKLKDSYNTYSITEEAIDAATRYQLPSLSDDGFYDGWLYVSNGGQRTDNNRYLCNYGGFVASLAPVTYERYDFNGDEPPQQRLYIRHVPEGAIEDATTLDGWKAFLKSRLPIEWYGE